MRIPNALDDIFRGRGAVRVLRALTDLPAGLGVSARELGRRAGVSHPTASDVLGTLSSEGIVTVDRAPRGDAYELNHDHVLVGPIAAMFATERGARDMLVADLRAAIKRLPVQAAYLFGSVTRMQVEATSDVDIAAVCAPDTSRQVAAGLDAIGTDVRARFGNRVNAVIATSDPRKFRGPRQRLWREILTEGISLGGTEARTFND